MAGVLAFLAAKIPNWRLILGIAAIVVFLAVAGLLAFLWHDNASLNQSLSAANFKAAAAEADALRQKQAKDKLKIEADDALARAAEQAQREEKRAEQAIKDAEGIRRYVKEHPESNGRMPSILLDTLNGLR